MNFNKKADTILENYKSIKTTTRLFYPRNFSLSREFVVAFNREYSRLKALGIKDRQILAKIAKALPFHKGETGNEPDSLANIN